ncbi:NAD(P)H-binding protein [Bifidobacterium xylocopae]|uniref:NAD(P)-binding domain-containing protein n=1 Tax=Bifidobacterium xylocopae TaxID=2493119 RepID=A0A366KD64_9BIFI|nr:NAD(P)H-binding protein [Bifidobacterium xylocopae]RBP99644.1 hypothetical protein CRD59_02620 [Bifidobacterium xylocopae]
MKVIVIGATGRVGRATVSLLTKQGDDVLACSRSADKISATERVHPLELDTTGPLATMVEAFSSFKADAVVFTAGSRGADVIHVDALGAIKTIEATKAAGIKRYVLLGALFSADLERWDEPEVKKVINQLPDYYPAKYFADDHLMHSGLDYTIVEPGSLVEEPGKGRVSTNPSEAGPIPIEDVAAMLAGSLKESASVGRIYRVIQGGTPIEQALR